MENLLILKARAGYTYKNRVINSLNKSMRRYNTRKVVLVACAFLMNHVTVLGQNTGGDTTNLGNVEVVTTYKPDVAESNKISLQPTLEDPKIEPPVYSYKFPNVAYKPKAVYSPIDPVFIRPEPKEDLFDNYIEVGGGNFLSSYLDASIHNTQDKYYTYGLKLKHHAASASKNPNQGLFSQNQIKAYGLREKGNDLYGELDYKRNVVHYYGYREEDHTFDLNDINQIYNDINAKLLWKFNKRRLNSNLLFDFNIFDKLGENENTVNFKNDYEFKVGKGNLHIDIGAMYTQLTETADYERIFVDVKPHYEFDYKKWKLDIGANFNYVNDFTSIDEILPAPLLKAETYLVPKKLRLYLGTSGDLKKNTLHSMSYENLFLGNNLSYTNPYVWKFWGGMNGSFKRFVEYGIKLQQELISDQYFFVSDTNATRNFTIVSDNMNKFTFSGEMKFDVNQNVDIGFRGNVYSYNLEKEQQAWHMPSYDAAAFATVRIADKIYINGGYFATGARKARNLHGTTFTLPAIDDINLGAEYRYKKNISGFINVNNILNQNYQIWNNYRSQGINVLAGITFSL